MGFLTDIIDSIKTLVESVTGVENVYGHRVTLVDDADFVSKFKKTDNTYLGFQIYRESRETSFQAFAGQGNKVRNAHTIKIVGIIGVKEDGNTSDTNTELSELMEDIADDLSQHITVDGAVADSEFPSIGPVDFDVISGRVLWRCELTWILYEDKIIPKIS